MCSTHVVVRPIRSEDRELVLRSFARLSPDSRYLRFHGPRSELSDAELAYLTDVDGVHHVAYIAVQRGGDSEEGLGIARFIRLDDEVAELAITVIDDYQRRGIGSLLFRRLAQAARERGMQRFRCEVLASNAGMQALLASFGAVITGSSSGAVTFEVHLAQGS